MPARPTYPPRPRALAAWRVAHELLAQSVADRAGIKQPDMSAFENGRKRPSPRIFVRVLTAIDELVAERQAAE